MSDSYARLEEFVIEHPMPQFVETLFRYLIYAIENNNPSVVESILHQLVENFEVIHSGKDDLSDMAKIIFFVDPLRETLHKLLLNKENFNNDSYDKSFILMMDLMIKLENSYLVETVRRFLEENFKTLLNNVLFTNYAKIIIPFLRISYIYSLHEELEGALKRIFKVDWEFLYDDLSEDDLMVIFWYAYLLDIDDIFFITITNEAARRFESEDGYAIYYYLHDCMDNPNILNREKYNQYIHAFRSQTGLTEYEKNHVLNKIQSMIDSLLKQLNFVWPSTEINDVNSNDSEFSLRQKSELRSFGYQITGMSRENRWNVLEKAVPELGLYKIAYTIAHNVKLRKGQKNGEIRYEHAITEWEHDLTRLKETYYNNDFRWPETDLK